MSHFAMLVLAVCCATQAESDAQPFAKLQKAWMQVCAAHAASYKIGLTTQPEETFRRLPRPIFRHAQLVRGGQDIGAVWLWVRKDTRPAAVGTIFCWDAGQGYRWMAHEFHSLAEEPLTATWRGREQWAPTRAGIEWKLVPNAPSPASSRTQRFQQIRAVARRFRGHSIDHRGGEWQLRLIPKPVYRYQTETKGHVLDGALYAMCQGTDPEIFLLVETRQTKEGPRWHYACAAFSDYRLHVELDGAEVWSPPKGTQNTRSAPHWWYGYIEKVKLPPETKDVSQDE